jgi:hypothetical protein
MSWHIKHTDLTYQVTTRRKPVNSSDDAYGIAVKYKVVEITKEYSLN